ncbi:MAG: cell division FtsZ family protein [Alistipes sp.]|nr:cell division FtsZ family protein [Alistipes sp.]
MEDYSILNDLVSIKSQPSRIMAMGVGGAGGNAIEHMWQMQIEGVNLAACNTDQDDLDKLHIAEENRILLGDDGLGAGNTADRGRDCAIASLDKVRDLLIARGTEMLFLAAGMGAGTGTGATPVIAELAHQMGILTVAIVTTPPKNEGPHRTAQANAGIEKLRKSVDAMILLSNDAINELYGHLPASTGFGRANDVVAFAAKGIAEIITHKSNLVNVDFSDVCTVMRDSGSAIMGVATESGDDRADKVIDKILTSPLFGDVSISGSRNVLVNISVSSAEGLTLNEAHRVRDRVQYHAKSEDENGNVRYTNIIWGMSIKPNLNEDEIEVVVVATGFDSDNLIRPVVIKNEPEPEVHPQEAAPAVEKDSESKVEPTQPQNPTPAMPKFRPAPMPIVRPARNFAEIEECKRVPAYITHGITLTTATKVHQISGVEKDQPAPESNMPALF